MVDSAIVVVGTERRGDRCENGQDVGGGWDVGGGMGGWHGWWWW